MLFFKNKKKDAMIACVYPYLNLGNYNQNYIFVNICRKLRLGIFQDKNV